MKTITRKEFIQELKELFNTDNVVYVGHNKATTRVAQCVEVAIDDKIIVFVIDTNDWINNPGVKFTYNDIIVKIKDGDYKEVVKYTEQFPVVAKMLYGVELVWCSGAQDYIVVNAEMKVYDALNSVSGVDPIVVRDHNNGMVQVEYFEHSQPTRGAVIERVEELGYDFWSGAHSYTSGGTKRYNIWFREKEVD